MNNLTTIQPENLPQLAYNGLPVVTTETAAMLFDVEAKNLRMNFKNNAARFIEGKHYFHVVGDDLRALKGKVHEIGLPPIASAASRLNLWTERGIARHAKMITNDAAWEIFERMEDCYFLHARADQAEPVVSHVEYEGMHQANTDLLEENNTLKDELLAMHRKYLGQIEKPKIKRKPTTPITDAEIADMRRLRADGVCNADIARRLHRSAASVSFILRGMA